jgi:hypothetical protein
MSWASFAADTFTETLGADTTSNATGQTVTASSSANTMGSYAQIGTSGSTGNTTVEYFGFNLELRFNSAVAYIMDVAIGTSGAQQIILNNLYVDVRTLGTGGNFSRYFPIFIPSGASVWIRCQASTGSSTLNAVLTGVAGDAFMSPPYRGAFGLGITSASTKGTAVDPGSTAGTLSGWSQIAANTTWNSISREIAAVAVMWGCNATTTKTAYNYLADIGIGASSSEQPILSNVMKRIASNNSPTPATDGPTPCYIPAGSRISMRFRPGTGVSATLASRDFDVALLGFVQ